MYQTLYLKTFTIIPCFMLKVTYDKIRFRFSFSYKR